MTETKESTAAVAETTNNDAEKKQQQNGDDNITKKSSSTNPLLLISYATIAGLWIGSQVMMIPYTVHLVCLVTAILYISCHKSLILREEPSTKEEDGGPAVPVGETLRQEDAMSFPILGSVSLFSLYLAFKFLDKELVNLLIGLYFCVIGIVVLYATLSPLIPKFGFHWSVDKKINHPLPKFIAESPIHIEFDLALSEMLILVASTIFAIFYFRYKHWAMNNILGICFCLQGIERFSLGTYKIGAILLVGLFFYDIFWVFGTDVMVTVAKNLDGPVKILFPRALNAETGKLEMSLLGLGDIVIPGFFLSLLLRFDAHKAGLPTSYTDINASFPKPYFHSALIAYIVGLGTTLAVMVFFNAAQPALLYLVPACLGSSWVCAAVRGELKELFDYSEEQEEEEEEKEEKTGEDAKPKEEEEVKEKEEGSKKND